MRGPGTAASIPEKFAFEAAIIHNTGLFSHVDIAVVATKTRVRLDATHQGNTIRVFCNTNGRVPDAVEIGRIIAQYFGTRST